MNTVFIRVRSPLTVTRSTPAVNPKAMARIVNRKRRTGAFGPGRTSSLNARAAIATRAIAPSAMTPRFPWALPKATMPPPTTRKPIPRAPAAKALNRRSSMIRRADRSSHGAQYDESKYDEGAEMAQKVSDRRRLLSQVDSIDRREIVIRRGPEQNARHDEQRQHLQNPAADHAR